MNRIPPKPGLFTPSEKDKKEEFKNVIDQKKPKEEKSKIDDTEFFSSSLDDILSELKTSIKSQQTPAGAKVQPKPQSSTTKQQPNLASQGLNGSQQVRSQSHDSDMTLATGDIRLQVKFQKKQIIELKSALDIQKKQILDLEQTIASRNDLLTKYNDELKKLKDEYIKVSNTNKILNQSSEKIRKDLEQRFIKDIREKDETIKNFESEKENSLGQIKKDYDAKISQLNKALKDMQEKSEKEIKDVAGNLVIENEKVKQELEQSKKTILDMKEAYQKTIQEVNDFKTRSKQTQDENAKFASIKLVSGLLDALDNLDRIVNIPVEDPKLKDYLLGFKMINESIFNVLFNDGVELVKTKGVLFDPNIHHAKEIDNIPDKEDDEILGVFQKGYFYKGRLVRPAVVKVNKKDVSNNTENNIN